MVSSQQILLRIQLAISASYFIVKFYLRPIILENEITGILKIFVLSYPNFCEALLGSIFLTFIFLILNNRLSILKEKQIPLLAITTASIYVLLQEFKIHNLGGNNVYDPYDVLFSILGLLLSYIIIKKIDPKYIGR